jgi:hypothetical protein
VLKSKHYVTISTLIISLILLLSIQTLAQYETKIVRTINYFQLREFQLGDIPGIGVKKISANGSKIVFSSGNKTIWTINTDGSNLVKVFDYADFRTGPPYISPHIEISADGSTITWTDGVGEIFVANSDGSSRLRIATEIPTATGVVGPGIPLAPRITADGSQVCFMNTNGGPDVAGGYKVKTNGSGLTQLFSYRQMVTQLFGMSGDEYNANIAFRQHLVISDNGSRLIFGTFSNQPAGHTIAVDGSSLRILFDYAPASNVGLAISGDGKKVILAANKFSGRTSIFSMNFGGSNQLEIVENTGGGPIFGGMTTDGSHVIAQAGNLPITLLRTDGNGRLDLVVSPYVTIQGKNPFFRAGIGNTISITPDGKRFCFPTVKEFGFSWQSQIWIADINPDSPGGAPAISDVSMSPGYVLNSGGSASTFKAWSTNNLESMTFDGFRAGVYADIIPAKHLYDNGTYGDATANDGLYTYNAVRSYNVPNPGAFSVRFVAAIRQHITAVDAMPFFIINQDPSGTPPTIASINPSSGEHGSQITITGTGFNPLANQNIVLIGNRQAVVISSSSTLLVVEIPSGLPTGTYPITVSTNGQTSNAGSISVGGGGPIGLNPPRNLVADIFENSVLIYWDPPLPGLIQNASNPSPRIDRKNLKKSLIQNQSFSINSFDSPENSSTTIDEIEPNDSPAQAQVLSWASPITLNGYASSSDIGTLEEIGDDIEDLFKVTTTSNGLKINLYDFVFDCDVYLFNEAGSELLDASTNADANLPEEIDLPELDVGTFLLGVSVYDNAPDLILETPYTLTLSGEFGDSPLPSNLLSYNIYRSNSPNARMTGAIINNVSAEGPSYFDAALAHNTYYYQVTAVYDIGESGPSNEAHAVLTNVKENPSAKLPDEFSLKQNFPNPFNPITRIEYSIQNSEKSQQVKLAVYNLLGKEIRTLVDKQHTAGFYSVFWDGKNNIDSRVPSGLYFCKMQTGSIVEMRKMILTR